jgi:hypothetical protein
MIVPFDEDVSQTQLAAAARELETVNQAIGRHGLSLSTADVQAIVVGRVEALEASDRVEFGSGVAKQIILGFAGSAFVSQENFVPTVLELQELFYEVKNESLEQIPDEDLIAKMRTLFDEYANGDVGLLEEALFEGLARQVREDIVTPAKPGFHDRTDADKADAGTGYEDAADPEADNAAANAYTLAAYRYDIGKWVDDKYEPGWDGSSWLDE